MSTKPSNHESNVTVTRSDARVNYTRRRYPLTLRVTFLGGVFEKFFWRVTLSVDCGRILTQNKKKVRVNSLKAMFQINSALKIMPGCLVIKKIFTFLQKYNYYY